MDAAGVPVLSTRPATGSGRIDCMGRTIWILGDQLTHRHTALAAADPRKDTVLMIESRGRGVHLRYHRIKLVLIYSAMRHFADELRERGWTVDYHLLEDTKDFSSAWQRHVARFGPGELWMMEPNAFFEDRMVDRAAKEHRLPLRKFPTCQFLVSRDEFHTAAKGRKRLLMENHYRATRQRLGILIDEDGKPEGGAWNFDVENRKTVSDWKKDGAPQPPRMIAEPHDAITREVITEVTRWFPEAPGNAEKFWLPVTRAGALRVLRTFVTERLVHFGNYQDLMLEDSRGMFHSWISAPLNIGLLDPMECVGAAVDAWRERGAPLAAVEGFVRQIVGWREFVNGVYWLKGPEYLKSNALGAEQPLPAFFESAETDMNCLKCVLREVHDTAYNHHIQRLMILGNFLLLAGVRPGDALRWFNAMYVDAFDWVMAANLVGMALHADGGFMATKPYAGSGAYISKMSNYCAGCRFDPKKKSGKDACPFNLLYWDFYNRHTERFRANPRTSMMVKSWEKRGEQERSAILREAGAFLSGLE